MNLNEFFSLKDRVAELEAEVETLKNRIRTEQKAKSKWRTRYEAVKPAAKSRRLAKNQKAYDMIAQREAGEIDATLADIGRECGVNYGTLKHMAYEYRQCLKVTADPVPLHTKSTN